MVDCNDAVTSGAAVPLCIDLDGTLVKSDMLHEALLDVAKRRPRDLVSTPFWLRDGKAAFKHRVTAICDLDVTRLPYRQEILDLIRAARAEGRPIILVTAAAPQIAHSIAAHLGLFDEVLCSDETTNLSADAKARRLAERFGQGGFDYAGNHHDDLPVWRASRNIIVVSRDHRLFRQATRYGQSAHRILDAGSRVALLKSLRPHQWLKNLLVFVPLVAGHELGNPALLLQAALAFVAFNLTASSIYIINDLLDLKDDRAHRTKHRRPFASGQVPIVTGLVTAALLLLAASALALLLPPIFLAVLAGYLLMTSAYSFRLKRQVMVDVILLAALYTVRVIAGAAATLIVPSFWLLAFSMFVFFSLALVKRYTELLNSPASVRELPGRGYRREDKAVLMPLGTASAMMSVLILALYVNSPQVAATYQEPVWLWLLPPVMMYWSARLWMKTCRGEVHDDPVIFALRDRQSLLLVLVLAPVLWAAQAGWQPWL